jgi:hypothetical protein
MRRPNKAPIFGDQNALVHLLGSRVEDLRETRILRYKCHVRANATSERAAGGHWGVYSGSWLVLAGGRNTGDRTENRDHHPGNAVPCKYC